MLCHGVGPLGGVSRRTNLLISAVDGENNRPGKPLLTLAILSLISLHLPDDDNLRTQIEGQCHGYDQHTTC
jgi:hypothetical protein